jgi:glycosyltransferase involved in cell wall biosynthesis
MDKNPSLSIIIPSWNQGRFIKRTLLSILKQEYAGPIQIIVSDGGSTDETVEVLKEFGDAIIWWSAKDQGFVDAVMKGTMVATGEILAIQSSDDYYLPGAFMAMAAAFHQHPDAGFVCGGECSIDLSGNIVSIQSPSGKITPETILFKTIPPQHGSFIKRSLFEKIDGLRSQVDMCADIDMWYRASHLQPGFYFNDVIAAYQLHPDQRTAVSDKWFPNLVKMVQSVEAMPEYGQHFRLSEKKKKDLFSYWEMNWTAKRDLKQGKKVAVKKIPSVFAQSKRTNQLLLGILFPDGIKKFLKSFGRATLPKANVEIKIPTNWLSQTSI